MFSFKSLAVGLWAACVASTALFAGERWTPEQANAWYAQQRWLIGSNFLPQSAINQLEMWQADTFDPATIDKELGWAESLGMNTMRVFLHDLVWQQDAEGFKQHIDQFLSICQKHRIKPLLVIFDSCWDPYPMAGKQHAPAPGVHNSGWVQSPGQGVLQDESQYPRLKEYVEGLIKAFGQDDRILGWDLWNEPDNGGGGKYPHLLEKDKVALVGKLLPQVFAWARSQNPKQPLTSGPWHNDSWAPGARPLNVIEQTQLNESDIITFHSYDRPADFEARIKQLQPYGRPIVCTEYMARGNGSTFGGSLPIAVKHNVGMINWGFVLGKSQTNMPWDSWDRPYVKEGPKLWFHDIFYSDGKPYRQDEVDLIKKLTSEADAKAKTARITIDISQAPQLADFAKKVQQAADEWYPKIAAALPSDGFTPPRQITITFDPDYKGVAECSGDRIKGSVKWFTDHPDDVGAFVHELVHAVQHYTKGDRPGWLTEGIADYIRWFQYEPVEKRPRPDAKIARYNASYRTSAAFLDWCQRTYDDKLVQKLNAACREARYADAMWKESTGKTLTELGEAWENSLK